MTQNDIFRLAVEAGAYWEHGDWNMPSAVTFNKESQLVKFAQLILGHEREACAKIADTWKDNVVWEARTAADNIAHQIRARGNNDKPV